MGEPEAAWTGFFAVLGVGVVPWTVLLLDGEVTLVFAFGLFNANPPHLVTIYAYLVQFTNAATLPEHLLAWPTSVLLYLGALANALSGLVWREDRRVTAGLLVFAGVAQTTVALGLSRGIGRTAVPFGAFCMWTVVWWFYWPDLRDALPASG